jgi:VWFA-related protein
MLRKSALFILLASIALPAFAAEQINVAQLEQILAAAQGKSHADLAEKLAGLELTDRLTSPRLEQLRAGLTDEKSKETLVALADASAFLDPPSADIPATATPDVATQRHIMALTVDYLGKTLGIVPNLFAARDTMSFETRPGTMQGIASADNPMHAVSKTRVTVFYSDGREYIDARIGKDKKPVARDKGLTTWGEFGSILGIVLFDAAHSRLDWSHWELAGGGPQAVFRYSVPKEKSHYDLRFCCVTESYGIEVKELKQRVGYHGEITVDPDTGTILRLTVLADIDRANPIGQADIAVEYGPVEIGGKTYYCPVRGIALAQAPDLKALQGALSPPPSAGSTGTLATLQKASLSSIAQGPRQTLLNDVAFREFHLFRSDSKIVTGAEGETASHPLAPPLAASAAISGSASSPGAAMPAEETAVDSSTLAPQPAEMAFVTAPTAGPPPEPVIPEITVADANGVPEAPSLSQEGTNSAVTLRLTARLVDVPLVALDKKGRPITNLKPEDLEIYDNGHKVDLRSFVPAEGAAPQPAPANPIASSTEPSATVSSHAYSNRTLAPVKTAGRDQPGNTIVLLIDSNLSWDDLVNVREQMRTFLHGLQGDERVALYVFRAGAFKILRESTSDHALVSTTLANWTPSAQNISLGQEQEARNRQTMDYVRTPEDLAQVNGHTEIDSTGNQVPTDPKLQALGDDPGRDVFSGLVNIASHLGAIPGHKSLVWIASDNVLADWTNSSLNIDKGNRIIQASVLHAQEAMNDAHVSVYPLDASRLEAGGIDASIGTRNVAVTPAYNKYGPGATCGLVSGSGGAPELSGGGDISSCQNDLRPGRAMAQMQQDLHPIQGAYRELADATGGRVFRRASDIISEFNSVAADGRATYLLSFTPALAADGKYHLITVKLTGRKDANLRYRSGFFYREEPTTIKARFRDIVLEPEDATEIALSADSLPGSSGHTVKLSIAATDLEIAQKDAFWTDKLDIFLVQREVSGTKAHVTGQTMGLRLKPSTYQQYLRDGIPFNQVVEIAPGVGSVRIVVLDENSGRMGSVTIPAAALKLNL